MGLGRVVLGLAIASLFASVACKEKEPPPPPPFSVADAAKALADVKLDDSFFKTLAELKTHAATDPDAMAAYVRGTVDGLAVALAGNPPAAVKLVGGDPSIPGAVGKALAALAAEAKKQAKTQPLATLVAGLAGAMQGPSAGDLTPTLTAASGDSELAPALRLLLARTLWLAIRATVDAPEFDRGPMLAGQVPGLPSPITKDPAATVFPRTLATLAGLLAKGPGKAAALAPVYQQLAADVAKGLKDRAFTVPVAEVGEPRQAAPMPAFLPVYSPLATARVTKDGLMVGARPVFDWAEGKPANRTAAIGWPGAVAAKAADLEDLKDETVETVKAAAGKADQAVAPVEASTWKALAGKAVLNADRKDRGLATVVLADPDVPSQVLKGALAALVKAGHADLALSSPTQVGRVLPVVFQKVPDVADVKPPKGPRVLAVVVPNAMDLYAPAKVMEKLPQTGWPEGVKVVVDQKKVAKLTVAWAADKGYGGAPAKAIAMLRKLSAATAFVDVVVPKAKDLAVAQVIDAAAEVLSVDGEPFAGYATWSPGLAAEPTGTWPAAVPILYSDAQVPKAPKAESTITETRPAGFCEKGAVQRVVMGRSGAYRACYEVELQRHPEMAGRVEIRFTIEPDGTVSGVAATADDLGNANVSQCLIKQLQGLNFPKPDGGVCVIRWPFKFQPGG